MLVHPLSMTSGLHVALPYSPVSSCARTAFLDYPPYKGSSSDDIIININIPILELQTQV